MPEVIKSTPGTFCWADLATHDVPGVKKFYGDVFGWTFQETKADGRTYDVAMVRGKPVAGIVQRTTEPFMPQWLNYIAVADAAAAVAKAESLGGRILAKPTALFDFAQVAYVQDPSLALVGLWQPGKLQGAGLVGEPLTMVWNELRTRNTGAATEFYTGLFDWKTQAMPGEMDYTLFAQGGPPLGGMMTMPREIPLFIPAHWLAYFAVEDVDATVKKAKAAGGKEMSPVMDIPGVGRIAAIADVGGTVVAMLKPAPR